MFQSAKDPEAVDGAEDGFDRGEFDVGVHASAPFGFAVGEADLDVGDGAGFGAGAEGVLFEIGNFKAGRAALMQGVDEGGEGAIAAAGEAHVRAGAAGGGAA